MPGRHLDPFWQQQPGPPAASVEAVEGPSMLQQRATQAASAVEGAAPGSLQQDSLLPEPSSASMAAAAALLGPPPTPLQLAPLLLSPEPQQQLQQPSIREPPLPGPERAEPLLSSGGDQLAEQLMVVQQPSGLSHEPQDEQQLLESPGSETIGPGAGTAAADFSRQPLAEVAASRQVCREHPDCDLFLHVRACT